MNCCQCNGQCNHIGPHQFCVAHGGQIDKRTTAERIKTG